MLQNNSVTFYVSLAFSTHLVFCRYRALCDEKMKEDLSIVRSIFLYVNVRFIYYL